MNPLNGSRVNESAVCSGMIFHAIRSELALKLSSHTHQPDCFSLRWIDDNMLLTKKLSWSGANRQWRIFVNCHIRSKHLQPTADLYSVNSAMTCLLTRRAFSFLSFFFLTKRGDLKLQKVIIIKIFFSYTLTLHRKISPEEFSKQNRCAAHDKIVFSVAQRR